MILAIRDRLLPALLLAACGESQPTVVAPTSPPLAVAPMPASSTSASAQAGDKSDPEVVALLVAGYARSLNEGDAAKTEASSTTACWAKECESLSSQAKRKFKVQVVGEPKVHGTHAVATMDIVCEGNRKCDLVYLLIEKGCALGAPQTWRVADVTEDGGKHSAWIDSAAAPCR